MREVIPRPARMRTRGPSLSRIDAVERVLRDAQGPLSMDALARAAGARGPATKGVVLAARHFERLGLAIIGSKGVQWTAAESANLRRALMQGRRL